MNALSPPLPVILFTPAPLAEALNSCLHAPLPLTQVVSFSPEEGNGAIFQRLCESVDALLQKSPPLEERADEKGLKDETLIGEGGLSVELEGEEDEAKREKPLLIICDHFGGRACTLALSLTHEPLEVLTGVNLPLLQALAHAPWEDSLAGFSDHLRRAGQGSIRLTGEALKAPQTEQQASTRQEAEGEKT